MASPSSSLRSPSPPPPPLAPRRAQPRPNEPDADADAANFDLAPYTGRVQQLQQALYPGMIMLPSRGLDEVAPGVFVAEREAVLPDSAAAMAALKQHGITHILNAAQGTSPRHVNTTAAAYARHGFAFLGLALTDVDSQRLPPGDLERAAAFVASALRSAGAVVVHCVEGVSRSATVALACLMRQERRPLEPLCGAMLRRRAVYPNAGFLAQLLALEDGLRAAGGCRHRRGRGRGREREGEGGE